jgi:hypothetical protein
MKHNSGDAAHPPAMIAPLLRCKKRNMTGKYDL